MTYNNLINSINRRAISEDLEHRVGHISGLDLSFKGYANINEVLNKKRDEINGKKGDLLYTPISKHSRPYYGYDARYDPTILNAIRNKNVDVSGLIIPNKGLSPQLDLNRTLRPLIPYGVIS